MKRPREMQRQQNLPRGECPHPEKMAFPTKKHAKRVAKRITGQRVYHCECGAYHLTKNRPWHTSKIEMHETRFGPAERDD